MKKRLWIGVLLGALLSSVKLIYAQPGYKWQDKPTYLPVHAPHLCYYAVVEELLPSQPSRLYHVWYCNGRWKTAPAHKFVLSYNPKLIGSQMAFYRTRRFDGSYPGLVWVENRMGMAYPAESSERYNIGRLINLYGIAVVNKKYGTQNQSEAEAAYHNLFQQYPMAGRLLVTASQQPGKDLLNGMHPDGVGKVAGRICRRYTGSSATVWIDKRTQLVLKQKINMSGAPPVVFKVLSIQFTHKLPRAVFELPRGTRVYRPADFTGASLPAGVIPIKMPTDIAATGIN